MSQSIELSYGRPMDLSPQRARTRQAILDAAAAAWAHDPSASLAQVAATAKVGRATLHRYFPDRRELHATLVSDSWATLRSAIEHAEPGSGSAADVLERFVIAMVHVGARVRFLFSATEGDPAEADSPIAEEVDRVVLSEIERAQREGTVDPDMPARWIELMIWSTVYTGLHAAADGLIPQHGVEDLIRRTLRRIVDRPPTAAPDRR